jgi:acyl transferase domain-containing protein
MTGPGSFIAVVGLAGRFPGAPDVDTFWQNLRAGVESISTFSDEQLASAGIDQQLMQDPAYVRAGGVLDGPDHFDAAFFGYTAREAELMDPQHRVLLECAWEALESAGYDPRGVPGRVGVFVGSGPNTYIFNLLAGRGLMPTAEDFQLILGNDRDHLATAISYKLDLRGPSLTIQTACSTSLVAVHLASQSLLSGESDMALAGGVSISFPQQAGYLHQQGMILSPDGHCRAFDARAQGTVGGSGAGLVVLRRLQDAVADGDHILAVIRGSAINNDGSSKAAFTAPSVQGQAEVIAEALAVADVDPATVSYVEAHGTGTTLGDPIEIAALSEAFGEVGDEPICAIGSLKTNIGHLDAAAGVAGLIKVALSLHHREIPPSLHFETPNPKLGLEHTPFHVNARLTDWPSGATPRRAGISSFGIGGTNAHAVLEEAPETTSAGPGRMEQLLVFSARSEAALESATRDFVAFGRANPDTGLADISRTLQLGRHPFEYRRATVGYGLVDATDVLERMDPGRVWSGRANAERPDLAFMFPGQGSQYGGMLSELYRSEPEIGQLIDTCAAILRPHLGIDVRQPLLDIDSADLDQTWLTQPALFVTEYVLARQWMNWGIQPRALIGHSLGEYVAACLAGVFSLEDGLMLVAQRGRLMQNAPRGAMLAVPLAEGEVETLLDSTLSLAAVNGPTQCVVAGPMDAVAGLRQRLLQAGIEAHQLRTSHAFHSRMLDSAAEEFARRAAEVALQAPSIPFISNVSGTWIRADEATSPAYWAGQLRSTVRFADGLRETIELPSQALLEVGPGRTLSGLARGVLADRNGAPPPRVFTSLGPRGASEIRAMLETLGRMWVMGIDVDWEAAQAAQPGRRIPLPTYPFERRRYWIDAPPQPSSRRRRETDRTDGPPLATSIEETPNATQPIALAPIDGPRNDTERIVAGVWGELLGLEHVGIHDDFLQLGGHSLLATQVAARLRSIFAVELPLREFLEAPTVEGLSLAIERERLKRVDSDAISQLLGEITSLSSDEVARLLATDLESLAVTRS